MSQNRPVAKFRHVARALANIEYDYNLEHSSPDFCIHLLLNANLRVLTKLNRKLRNSSKEWIVEFVNTGGLLALLNLVDKLCQTQDTKATNKSYLRANSRNNDISNVKMTNSRTNSSFFKSLILSKCICCIKELMNSKYGMETIIELAMIDSSTTNALSKASLNSNQVVKKEVFQILSALAMYSTDGYTICLSMFENIKKENMSLHRFDILIDELKNNKNSNSYLYVVVGLINCVISQPEELKDRMAIKFELNSLNINDLLNELKKTADDDLIIQIDTYEDLIREDEEEAIGQHGFDLNNPVHLFNALYLKFEHLNNNQKLLDLMLVLYQLVDENDKNNKKLETLMSFLISSTGDILSRGKIVKSISEASTQTIHQDAESTIDSKKSTPVNSSSTQRINITELTNKLKNMAPLAPPSYPAPLPPVSPSLNSPPLPPRRLKPKHDSVDNNNNEHHKFEKKIKEQAPISENLKTTKDNSTLLESNHSKNTPQPLTTESFENSPFEFNSGKHAPAPPPPHSSFMLQNSSSGIPPPPPPMPFLIPSKANGIPAPPPPPPLFVSPSSTDNISTTNVNIPPPPPPPGSVSTFVSLPPPPPLIIHAADRLEKNIYSTLPKSNKPLKNFAWQKVPNSALQKENLWKEVNEKQTDMKLDFKLLEELFVKTNQLITTTKSNSFKPNEILGKSLKSGSASNTNDSPSAVVTILDPKQNMSISVFLKTVKVPLNDFVKLILDGRWKDIGLDHLGCLKKILPDKSDVEAIQSFYEANPNGLQQLGKAEQFIKLLTDIPMYELRIDIMNYIEEFDELFNKLKHPILTYLKTSKIILTSKSIKSFISMVLAAGNFLNMNSYNGQAVGFKIAVLPKLLDIKTNKPSISFLHVLVEEYEKENNEFDFVDDLKDMSAIINTSLSNLSNDFKLLKTKTNQFISQLGEESTPHDVKIQFQTVLENCNHKVNELEKSFNEIDNYKLKLIDYYCEDTLTFDLNEFLKNFNELCLNIIKVKEENKLRKLNEEKIIKRKEELNAIDIRRKSMKILKQPPNSEPNNEDVDVLNNLLSNLKSGKVQRQSIRRNFNKLTLYQEPEQEMASSIVNKNLPVNNRIFNQNSKFKGINVLNFGADNSRELQN